ncbi:MAG: hypothetical protein RJA70_4432, partial [Pseudomonadota bacterium]
SYLQRAGYVAAFVVLVLGVLLGKVLSRGTDAMAESDRAFSRGDLSAALEQATVASEAYVPWAPHLVAAEARLRALALGAESTGQRYLAQRAWSALRSSRIQVAHPWTSLTEPFDQGLRDANSALPDLLQPAVPVRAGDSIEDRETALLSVRQAYQRDVLPRIPLLVGHTLGMLLLLLAGTAACFSARFPTLWVWSTGGMGVAFWILAALGA